MSGARRPRVLHLMVHPRGGGTETTVRLLCRRMPGHSWLALEDELGLPFRWSRLPGALRRIRARRPDVVFCYGLRGHLIGLLAYPLGGAALVGNFRGERDFAGWREVVRRVLLRPRMACWVANSRAGLKGERRGVVIRPGVPLPRGDERPLLAGLERPVYGVLANERPMKGHRWLLALWRRMGLPGTLVFGGRLSRELRAEAEAAGVRCAGVVPAGPFLRSLELLLIPSSSEGLPRVLVEARVRGVPVLATPVGGVPELIRHGENGFVLPREQWERFLRTADWEAIRRAGERARVEEAESGSFAAMRAAVEEVVRRAGGVKGGARGWPCRGRGAGGRVGAMRACGLSKRVKRVCVAVALAGGLALGGARAAGDVVVHRNGQRFEGVIVLETAERVVIRLSGTELSLARELVESIERSGPQENEVLRMESSLRTGNALGAMKALLEARGAGVEGAALEEGLARNEAAFVRALGRLREGERVEARHLLMRLRDDGFAGAGTLVLLARGFLEIGAPLEASACLQLAGLESLQGDESVRAWARPFLRDLIRALAVQGRYAEAVEQIERLRMLAEEDAVAQLPLLYLAESARARRENRFEAAARILAEDLAPTMPEIARNRAVVTLRAMTAWAEQRGQEREARRVLQTHLLRLIPLEALAARQRLYASQARRHLREGDPVLALRLLEPIPAEERSPELEALLVQAQFDARRETVDEADPEAMFGLALWATDRGLYEDALRTLRRLRENPVLLPLADEQIGLLTKERDMRRMREALALYDSGLPQQALEICVAIEKDEGYESRLREEARQLAELARREIVSDTRRRPYQAEALYQQAERSYFVDNIDEAWKLIDLLLREYGDTPAAERAAGLLPDVAREFEVQLLEGRRRKLPSYESAVSHTIIRQSEQLDQEIQRLLESL